MVATLTSNATFYGLTFNNSRTAGTYRYNIQVSGTDTNLAWWLFNYGGPRAGDDQDYDPNAKVHWGIGNRVCDPLNSTQNGNWSSPGTWDLGFVPTSCNPVNIVVGTTVTVVSSSMNTGP